MLSKGVKKYLTNPIIGILPFVVYIILQTYVVPDPYAFGIAIATTLFGEFFLRKYFNSRIYALTFYFTLVALSIIALLWIVGNDWINNGYTFILAGEVAIIIQLMIFRLGKSPLKTRLFKKRTFIEKVLLDNCFQTAAILKYLLTIHVFSIVAFKQVTGERLFPTIDYFIYVIAPCAIILTLFIYQIFRSRYTIKKLHEEEWLPIVTEKGEVTGRIARTVSQSLKNTHMHPVVRIALICNKKVYIKEKGLKNIVDAGKLDHPFEKYMLFRHEVSTAAHNSIRMVLGTDIDTEPTFITQYVFENNLAKRLIFLFSIEIEDESIISRTEKMTGKFWTVKQIDQEFGDGVFSECFELEYEYLKHMILLGDADELISIKGEK